MLKVDWPDGKPWTENGVFAAGTPLGKILHITPVHTPVHVPVISLNQNVVMLTNVLFH